VSGAVTLSISNGLDAEAPLQKTRLYAVLLLSFVVVILREVVAFVAVVAFPSKSPLNSVQLRREVFGLYDNGVTLLSTNSADEEDTVLLNGIKYAPLVSSLVNKTEDAVEAVDAMPLKFDAVSVLVLGLYVNGIVALSANSWLVEVTVLLNGMKYDPLVLSLVNAIDDAELALPRKDVAVSEWVNGLYVSADVVSSMNRAEVGDAVVLENGI
jgi:hypothetical protein